MDMSGNDARSRHRSHGAPIILLPGLDGTGLLLQRFCQCIGTSQEVRIAALPDGPAQDYESLADFVSESIGELESCHLIAESFSGPIGILLADRHPKIVRHLTLVASFATSPVPVILRYFPWAMLFRLPLPAFIARRFLIGENRSLVVDLRNAIRKTSARTLANRVRCLLSVDVTRQLSGLNCGITFIRPTADGIVGQQSVDVIIAANPKVIVREIAGPHLVLQTMPEHAWNLILENETG